MDREKSVLSGVLGGLVGGLAFGAMMGMMGMLPMVAKMVGSSSAVVGFGLHLLISAFIGGTYGLIIGHRSHNFGTSLLFGAGYGLLWLVLGPLTLMPTFLGMGIGVNWNLAAAGAAMPSLEAMFDEEGSHLREIPDWAPLPEEILLSEEQKRIIRRPSIACPRPTAQPSCWARWRG